MSSVIASIILRKLSACASALERALIRVSLLTPSTSSATSAPNRPARSGLLTAVSSSTSCSSAAMIVAASSRMLASRLATARGCLM